MTSVFERIQFRDGLVHVDEKGLAGDIKLRFQIPKAYSFKPQPNGRNIVGRNLLRAFGHPVATCCEVLRYVGCCWLKFENGQRFHATFVDIAWCCGRLAKFVHRCTRACALVRFSIHNMSQHVTTGCPNARNMLRPTCCPQQCCDMLHWNAAIVWPELANVGPTLLGYVAFTVPRHKHSLPSFFTIKFSFARQLNYWTISNLFNSILNLSFYKLTC